MSKYDTYTSPLAERNASPEMLRLWSARHKFNTWRRIWLAVAEAQHELTRDQGTQRAPSVSERVEESGSTAHQQEPVADARGSFVRELVTQEQVEELRAVVERKNPDGSIGITDDEIRAAEKYERELRHDVMAHVHALGDSCPNAKGIIHLGMTSQDVVCNADHSLLHEALTLVDRKLVLILSSLGDQAHTHRWIPTLGFTHYQAAQPVTVGRRVAQWAFEVWLCRRRLYNTSSQVDARGLRGATGTQAAFLKLAFDHESSTSRSPLTWETEVYDAESATNRKVNALEDRFGFLMDWEEFPSGACQLTTQTYPRVIDTFILADLASTASVLHKIATDIRLLCNRKELDEPFETKQIGSSAMPYKRNPMRCERICGLTRFVMNLVGNAYDTAATQWLERTLDDSSNRRLSLPEAFLALDGALDLMHNVASGLIVHEATVRKNLMAELPFMATENILMECVKLGGDRQEFHELIRTHAQAAGLRVKDEGLDNDLIDRLKNDRAFWPASRGGTHGLRGELNWGDTDPNAPPGTGGLLDPMKYIGRSIEQTERFIKEVVEPLRAQYGEAIDKLGQSGPRV